MKIEVALILGLRFLLPLSGMGRPVTLASCTASCVCFSGDRDFAARVRGTAAIFVGTVIDARHPLKGRPGGYTFLLDSSWKGPTGDTIVVGSYGRVCETFYVPGGTYLVFAASDATGLVATICADPIWLSEAKTEVAMLNSAKWRAPPVGQRPIDALVRRTLTRQRDSIVQPLVVIRVMSRQYSVIPGAKVELLGTGLSAVTDSMGRAVFRRLALGWYRARLSFTETKSEDHYLRVRCDTDTPFNPSKKCWIAEPTLIPREL